MKKQGLVAVRDGVDDFVGDCLPEFLGGPAEALDIVPLAPGGRTVAEAVVVPIDGIDFFDVVSHSPVELVKQFLAEYVDEQFFPSVILPEVAGNSSVRVFLAIFP